MPESNTMTSLRPEDLHCEFRRNPLGIDEREPRFGWALDSHARGARQTAWQIQVGSRPGASDAWDSGQVAGDLQLHIVYAGAALASRTRYHWRVRVWNEADTESPWSETAWFETAFLDPADFAAPWIGTTPGADDERLEITPARWIWAEHASDAKMVLLRTSIVLPTDTTVQRARLIYWAQGRSDPWAWQRRYIVVNGRCREAWHWLVLLRATNEWEIGAELKPGENQIAVRTWAEPDSAFIAIVMVELTDGRRLRFATGSHPWQARPQADDTDHAGWDDPAASEWETAVDRGAFGQGPWPANDIRNRADKLVPPVELRHEFTAAKPVTSARIYVTACGIYELALNGRRVDDRWLAPGWTGYHRRLHYQTYDVSDLVCAGANDLHATVADGWYSGQNFLGHNVWGTDKALKLQLYLLYADGSTEIIRSDPGLWQAGIGALRYAELFHGQHEDRTRATVWRPAVALQPEHGVIHAQPDEPVRSSGELPVRSLIEKRPGVFVADFGQNVAGVVRLRIRAPRGTQVTLRFAEVLDLTGELWTENLRYARATDVFTCAGGGEEIFEPHFTFHGFRYCEVAGLPAGLRPEQVTAVVITSDLPDCGTFACDNPLLTRLQENIRWGWRGNSISVPTDCPQRDERMGWTGDAQIFVGTACFNTSAAPFYEKYQQDMIDTQHTSGALPDFAPCHSAPESARYGWADAGIIIPWTLWRSYGDTRVVERHWAAMRRYLDHRDAHAQDELNLDWSFGDWVSPDPQTPNEVLGPIYHAWMHRLMAEMALGVGKSAEATHHRVRFARISAAWQAKHLAADGRIHSSDTQCAYVCALRAGLIPEARRANAGEHLINAIERAGWHLHTGFLGTGHLLPAISETGRDDVAWRVLLQETAPGWLYTVKNGATTMWERWNSYSPETGPVNIGNMNSYNHYAFGAVGEWMYGTILGLAQADGDIGWQRMIIRPVPGGNCRHARGSYRSLRGEVRCAWWIIHDRITLEVTVPPNCSAEVHVPTHRGSAATTQEGAQHVRDTPTHAVFSVDAGTYSFSALL